MKDKECSLYGWFVILAVFVVLLAFGIVNCSSESNFSGREPGDDQAGETEIDQNDSSAATPSAPADATDRSSSPHASYIKLLNRYLIISNSCSADSITEAVNFVRHQSGNVLLVYPEAALLVRCAPETADHFRAHADFTILSEGEMDLDEGAFPESCADRLDVILSSWHDLFPKPTVSADGDGRFSATFAPEPLVDDAIPPQDQNGAGVGALMGKVGIMLFTPESSGIIDADTEQWTPERWKEVHRQIASGLAWWAEQAASRGLALTFTLYHQALHSPILATDYEPITRSGAEHCLWINQLMRNLKYETSADCVTNVKYYNAAMSELHGLDQWLSVFVVDSQNDADGKFSDHSFAFAHSGGPYIVLTSDNGSWGLDRLEDVFRHELGHVFQAGDDSPSFQETVSRPRIESATDGAAPCVMEPVFKSPELCAETEAEVGWSSGQKASNDTCVDAIMLGSNGTYDGDTSPDMDETTPWCVTNPEGGMDEVFTVWATPSVSELMVITVTSEWDNVVYVREALENDDCGGAGNPQVACTVSSGTTTKTSQVSFLTPSLNPPKPYFVFVDGLHVGSMGPFTITVQTCNGCWLENICFQNLSHDWINTCRYCDVGQSRTEWTYDEDGTSCNDTYYCNGTDTCQDQICEHSGTPCHADGFFCNGSTSQCDEDSDTCYDTGDPCPEDGDVCNGITSCNETTDSCEQSAALVCNDQNLCTNDHCDRVTGCNYDPNNLPCEDNIYCNGTDTCNNKTCSLHTGNPCPINDGLFCNGAETSTCIEASDSCAHTGNPCLDDGAYCNGAETCNEGQDTCQHTGNPCPEDDGIYCNGIEHQACDEGTDTCLHTGDPCADDGLFCNGITSCNETLDTCNYPPISCPDDGLFCNGAEMCDENSNQCYRTAAPCQEDGLFCNGVTSCSEEQDKCVTTPAPCVDDGLWCTGVESCDEINNQCHTTGNPCPLDDHEFCNGTETSVCNEQTDSCGHTGNPCADDGVFCNGVESCNETSDSCASSGNPCPDDGFFCDGQEECDEGQDSCIQSDVPCADDGAWCNGAESCNEETHQCDHEGNPCPLDDGNFCNGTETSTCDEQADSCGHTGDPCHEDGLWCNGLTTCSVAENRCVTSAAPCSDDGQWCNGTESCNETTDQCNHTGNPCPLDDGYYCNGTETSACDEQNDSCGHEGDPCPDDNVFCNGVPLCIEATDQCQPGGNPCPDDGFFCSGQEICDEDADGCYQTGFPCSDDGLWCNGAESCNETSDQCEHTGNPCPLDNGVFCDGIETSTCNETNDACVSTGNPCPIDDGLYCNGPETDVCIEASHSCGHTGNPCPADPNVCDGGDFCDENQDACTTVDPPNCDDSNVCTTDSCDPVAGCQHVEASGPCDDGNACTMNDTCVGGGCQGTLAPGQFLHVLTPAPSTALPGGVQTHITWDYGTCPLGTYSYVRLTASVDGGATYPVTINGSAPDTGSYTWTAPAINNDNVRIKITAGSYADTTDGNFSVYMPVNAGLTFDAVSGDVTLHWDGGVADVYSWEGKIGKGVGSWTLRAENITSPWTDPTSSEIDVISYRLTNADGSFYSPQVVNKKKMSLSYGYNLIALPFELPEDYTAQDLLDEFNDSGEKVKTILQWDSGSQWWDIHYNAFPDYNDFELKAGGGYFIEVVQPVAWVPIGPAVLEPIETYMGYDFILLGAPTGQYPLAQDFLDAVTLQGGLGNALYRWDAEQQQWDAHFTAYPAFNNYALENQRGYFLKNDSPVNFSMNPMQLVISQITHTGFKVTWRNSWATTGWIRYGTNPGALTAVAAENWSSLFTAKTTHTITVTGLSGGTYYFDVIASGSLYDNRGEHYSVVLP